jgi:hypothetical protein
VVDGTTLSLPDTAANQAAYPQSRTQKAGLGFPVRRMVALLCLASGALLDTASGPREGKGSDEQTLLRTPCSIGSGPVTFCSAMPSSRPISCSVSWCAAASMGYSSNMAHANAGPTFTPAPGSVNAITSSSSPSPRTSRTG